LRSVFREYCLPALLLVASIATTTANGARFMQNFIEGMPPVVRDSDLWPWAWLAEHPDLYAAGWSFSASLLGILLIHEFGHYFACRWHKIRATLPWVLPAPTLSGTAGAVIQIRSRIPTRDALMDVGIYGPLAGYVASAIAVAVGFTLSFHSSATAPTAIVVFGSEPPTIRLLHALLVQWDPSIPSFEHIAPHPILVAGWIGLFITSLNLIPGGQLDGGHILYAISHQRAALPALHRRNNLLGGLDSLGFVSDASRHAPSKSSGGDGIAPRPADPGRNRYGHLSAHIHPDPIRRQLSDALLPL
jgi:Zn-dependent protease